MIIISSWVIGLIDPKRKIRKKWGDKDILNQKEINFGL
jgi:hypothetical protein